MTTNISTARSSEKKNLVHQGATTKFEIFVSKEKFKFNAGHFVAFKGFRERLHGHNYKVSVRLLGSRHIFSDGYVLDFGDVKKATEKVCKSLNEYFLCPMYSDVLEISLIKNLDTTKSVQIMCEDGARFIFPEEDVLMLPIVHSTAEELAIFVWGKILRQLGAAVLLKRGIHTMEVTVAEAVGQEAVFRTEIPTNGEEIQSETGSNERNEGELFDVRDFIMQTNPKPTKCLVAEKENNDDKKLGQQKGNDSTSHNVEQPSLSCCKNCVSDFSKELEIIANAINNGKLKMSSTEANHIVVDDLKMILRENVNN